MPLWSWLVCGAFCPPEEGAFCTNTFSLKDVTCGRKKMGKDLKDHWFNFFSTKQKILIVIQATVLSS